MERNEPFDTEFPPHSVSQGRVPAGYTGPMPTRADMADDVQDAMAEGMSGPESDEGSKDGSGESSEGSGDEEVENPEAIDSTGDGTPDDHGNIAPPPTLAAWIARTITVGVLLAIIGYLVYLCLKPHVPANFEIELAFDEVEQRGGSWVLPVSVTNTSTESMGNVNVEVVQGDTTRSFSLMLMGEGERGEAEVRFPERPIEGEVEADVVSYVSP